MDLLDFRQWRRLRYSDPRRAEDALGRLAHNTAQLELRLRKETAPADAGAANAGHDSLWSLYVGGDGKWIGVLERMAADFGLQLEPAHPAPKPLARVFVPGHWETVDADADAKLMPGGMYVGATGKGATRDKTREPGAAVRLPALTLGLHSEPALPYPVERPADSVWSVGQSGLGAPARLVGEADSQMALLLPVAHAALSNGTPTIIVDNTGDLSDRVRQQPELARLVTLGQLQEISLAHAGLRGFNPLAESPAGEAATLLRWRWWLRGLGVHDPDLVDAAYRSGARTFAEAAHFWASQPRMLPAAHTAERVLHDPVSAAWLDGSFDVARHLSAGGHLLVDAPEVKGVRVQALRGLLGLILEAAMLAEQPYRVLSLGLPWTDHDWRALENLRALHAGRGARWDTVAFTRCAPDLAERIAHSFQDARLGEYLRTLPDGASLAANRKAGKWWAWGTLSAASVATAERELRPLLEREPVDEADPIIDPSPDAEDPDEFR